MRLAVIDGQTRPRVDVAIREEVGRTILRNPRLEPHLGKVALASVEIVQLARHCFKNSSPRWRPTEERRR
jgi:hypothetical protein